MAAGQGKLSKGRKLSGVAITNPTARSGAAAGFRKVTNPTAAIAIAASASVAGSRSRDFHDLFALLARSLATTPVVVSVLLPRIASENSRAVENLSAGSFS